MVRLVERRVLKPLLSMLLRVAARESRGGVHRRHDGSEFQGGSDDSPESVRETVGCADDSGTNPHVSVQSTRSIARLRRRMETAPSEPSYPGERETPRTSPAGHRISARAGNQHRARYGVIRDEPGRPHLSVNIPPSARDFADSPHLPSGYDEITLGFGAERAVEAAERASEHRHFADHSGSTGTTWQRCRPQRTAF